MVQEIQQVVHHLEDPQLLLYAESLDKILNLQFPLMESDGRINVCDSILSAQLELKCLI